jgi:hypothetical protein
MQKTVRFGMKSEIIRESGVVSATRNRWPYLVTLAALGMAGGHLLSAAAEVLPTSKDSKPGSYRDNQAAFQNLNNAYEETYRKKHDQQFIENPDFNAVAWRNAPAPPIEIEKNFILSDTFLDEESRPWRAEMHKRFAPVVKDCKTRREAILAVAKNAATVCGVKYDTTRRAPNQCVAESLESHKASCTGLSILLAAAYRSVGIPARIAGVGEWGDRPGNHTWVEVWDDDGWHVIEYYPDEKGLDKGWIYEPITKLDPANPRSRVFAVDPSGSKTFFLPWAPENSSVSAVDRTEDYLKVAGGRKVGGVAIATTGAVVFEAKDKAGVRVALPFRVLDGDKQVFTGKTPGPLDDLNNAPRAELKLNHGYTVEYTDRSGAIRTVSVSAKVVATTSVVIPVE